MRSRILGIVVGGSDVEPVGDLRNWNPSEVETKSVGKVPGVDGPASNLFGVSQVLAWIAGQRADLGDDLEWRGDVPELIGRLAKRMDSVQENIFG
jgi:hypothetical protein